MRLTPEEGQTVALLQSSQGHASLRLAVPIGFSVSAGRRQRLWQGMVCKSIIVGSSQKLARPTWSSKPVLPGPGSRLWCLGRKVGR